MELDPAVAKKKAAEEEERRLAEIRAHGTPVTAETFTAWRAQWDAESALSEDRLQVGAGARFVAGRSCVCICLRGSVKRPDHLSCLLQAEAFVAAAGPPGKQWFQQQEAAGSLADVAEVGPSWFTCSNMLTMLLRPDECTHAWLLHGIGRLPAGQIRSCLWTGPCSWPLELGRP